MLATFFCFDAKICHVELDSYIQAPIREDLLSKMVFVAGPRQVGKTTCSPTNSRDLPDGGYFHWDNREDRREIRAPVAWRGLCALDELHKWRGWKN